MLSSVKRFKYSKQGIPRMWIDGHCFEIKSNNTEQCEEGERNKHHDLFNIKEHENGKLCTKFRLPNSYCNKLYQHTEFSYITFQENTNTTLNISLSECVISISGDASEDIAKARDELHKWIFNMRYNERPLQFIAIPTLNETIQSNFRTFKEEILKSKHLIKGMEESVFQKPEKLHLTLSVFALLDDSERNECIKELQNCKEDVLRQLIGEKPLKIRLKGLNCMNNNFKKVDVLYANAELEDETENLTLQQIANEISNHFYQKGFSKEGCRSVKLHVTLINTKYRSKTHRKRFPIDATFIMENYKDYDFGVCDFDSIHLSLMGAHGEDGFYEPLSVINL